MDGVTATRHVDGEGRRDRDVRSTAATATEGAMAMEGVRVMDGATAMDGATVTAIAMVAMDDVAQR